MARFHIVLSMSRTKKVLTLSFNTGCWAFIVKLLRDKSYVFNQVDFLVATLVFRCLSGSCHHRYIALRTWTQDAGLDHQPTPTSCYRTVYTAVPVGYGTYHFRSTDREHGTMYRRQYAQRSTLSLRH